MSSDSRGLSGQRVSVSWTWGGTGERPVFRLMRGCGVHGIGETHGEAIVDSASLLRSPDEAWERVSFVRCFAGEGRDVGVRASVAFFHDVPGGSTPLRVEVRFAADGGEPATVHVIDDVTHVVLRAPDSAAQEFSEELEIYSAATGRPETLAGVLTLLRDRVNGATPTVLRWAPSEGSVRQVELSAVELTHTCAQSGADAPVGRSWAWQRVVRVDRWDLAAALSDPADVDPALFEECLTVTIREERAAQRAAWTRSVRVTDLCVPDAASSYALLAADPSDPAVWRVEREWDLTESGRASVAGAHPAPASQATTPDGRGSDPGRRLLKVLPVVLDRGTKVRYPTERSIGDQLRESTGPDPHLLSPN